MFSTVEQLHRALDSVGALVEGVREKQWSAPTPCTDWNVRSLVNHLVGVNAVFTALLNEQAPPERGTDLLGEDPAAAYHRSAQELLAAFRQPGTLERTFAGPLGTATGTERLRIRIADLLAHSWDLGRATGQAVNVPGDWAEQALTFLQEQLETTPRTGRFEPAQPVADDAPALDRLVAFLGRSPSWTSA